MIAKLICTFTATMSLGDALMQVHGATYRDRAWAPAHAPSTSPTAASVLSRPPSHLASVSQQLQAPTTADSQLLDTYQWSAESGAKGLARVETLGGPASAPAAHPEAERNLVWVTPDSTASVSASLPGPVWWATGVSGRGDVSEAAGRKAASEGLAAQRPPAEPQDGSQTSWLLPGSNAGGAIAEPFQWQGAATTPAEPASAGAEARRHGSSASAQMDAPFHWQAPGTPPSAAFQTPPDAAVPAPPRQAIVQPWRQCGGLNGAPDPAEALNGPWPSSRCVDGFECTEWNRYFYQCQPAAIPYESLKPYDQCGGISQAPTIGQSLDKAWLYPQCSRGYECTRLNSYYWQCLLAAPATPRYTSFRQQTQSTPPGTAAVGSQAQHSPAPDSQQMAAQEVGPALSSTPLSASVPAPAPSPDCTNLLVPGPYNCTEQRDYGKCFADFMLNNGNAYCNATCGRCPSICTDIPLPAVDHGAQQMTCAQQAALGRCATDLHTGSLPALPDGYCALSCKKCGHSRPS